VKIGLHIADFTYPSGPKGLADDLTRIAATAEEEGFARVSVMDHVWQIGVLGPPEHEMLEAYTTLGYLAARTERVELLAWVTAVSYRRPGMLAKIVSTLDVLSKGRAWLGIGAAWNEDEATGLGLDFPSLGERFERLEETLQICLQMWSEDEGPYDGRHYQLRRTLNRPQPLQEPRPRILVGGGGERKTLRLVAQYADACNLFAGGEIERKLGILREHCDAVGRDYEEIEKTAMGRLDPADRDGLKAELQRLARLGVEEYHGMVPDASGLENLRILGREIIPFAAELEPARTA
jgi:alkanesulfonate monooxygenase